MFEKIPSVKKIIIHYWVELKRIEGRKKWQEEERRIKAKYTRNGSFNVNIKKEWDRIQKEILAENPYIAIVKHKSDGRKMRCYGYINKIKN